MWRHEHVNRIDDEIIAQIRKSRFMVADFTSQNPGAYFEAGLMQGLGRPVFWMCNDAEREKLHFDTRQYNHILYTDLGDARVRLHNRIIAVVGEGKGPEIP
jgi:nucleoside 2-deoxyribosyltransferase